jgi:hypothetical protein
MFVPFAIRSVLYLPIWLLMEHTNYKMLNFNDPRNMKKRKKISQRGALEFVLIPKYHLGDLIKENEVGRARSTHGRGEESVQCFGGKARRKEPT